MKIVLVASSIFVLVIGCSTELTSKIHIDSNTSAFEKIVNPPSSANVFKYEIFIDGYSDDTIMINGSRTKGLIKFHSGLGEFYGIPPMKVIYDPLKAQKVNIDIEYHFY